MNQQEKELIEAIKAKPGYLVWPGRLGGATIICHTTERGVSQQSVWLGRSKTIENLQAILAK